MRPQPDIESELILILVAGLCVAIGLLIMLSGGAKLMNGENIAISKIKRILDDNDGDATKQIIEVDAAISSYLAKSFIPEKRELGLLWDTSPRSPQGEGAAE